MKRDTHGPVDGRVRSWHDDEGWGVLVPDGEDLEVWALFAMIDPDAALPSGYRKLHPGQRVHFSYETPGDDGYAARACDGIKTLD